MMPNCYWSDIFDDDSRKALESYNVAIASLSAILSLWLLLTIFFSNLKSDLSYRNLAFFILASFLRCTVSVILYLAAFDCQEGTSADCTCNFLGFWESFLSVYEVECLTHICIERYVVAKYIVNGWEIQKNHYGLYQFLCVMFAAVYSLPPLLGLGAYAPDFLCNSCVLDMVLPQTWDRYVVMVVYLLRSVKSTWFMIAMLYWAHQREARFQASKNVARPSKFTQNIMIVTAINLFLWFPVVVIRGRVIFSFLVYNQLEAVPSPCWIKWAMWMQWMAPASTAIALYFLDDTLRDKMKTLFYCSKKVESNKIE